MKLLCRKTYSYLSYSITAGKLYTIKGTSKTYYIVRGDNHMLIVVGKGWFYTKQEERKLKLARLYENIR